MKKNNFMNYQIKLNDSDYNVIITKKKVKRIIIRVNFKNEILVNVPESISYNDALNKVFSNSKWIEKTLNKHQELNDLFNVDGYLNKDIVYIGGVKYKLVKDNDIKDQFCLNGDTFFYKNSLNKAIDLIYQSYYYLLEEEFNKALTLFKNKAKQIPNLTIRKMKSRWGSCNYHTGKIVLNKMLISVPYDLLRYVVLHEFTHLLFPNHSKDFYNYLYMIYPSSKIIEKQLKKYSFLLS